MPDKSELQPTAGEGESRQDVDQFGIADWMRKAAADCIKVLLASNVDEVTLRGVFVRKIADAYKDAQ